MRISKKNSEKPGRRSKALLPRKKKMPELNKIQFVYDPTENFSVGSDFTIVLAEG